ncbi:MmgE/PrpD family protein [Natronomonas marina]|uniref:MmgE/PrpD family protein n=1 Tax=Natronomonas marina TaxID=2961939 RepID=UPI0020C945D4|nr:MmgE/PrpD family protein [Natronomonas marina]
MRFDRRSLLQGLGGLGALTALGRNAVREADAQDAATTVPEAARSVEAGLELFAAKWTAGGPIITATRFGRFLTNRTFNCRVVLPATDEDGDGEADPSRAYTLALGTAGATVTPGATPTAHAELTMDEGDWEDVLYGEYTGLAPIMNGRAYPNKDQANSLVGLALVMYVLAHVPHPDADPRFTAETLDGLLARGGVPSCEGEPESFETLARTTEDPAGELRERAFGANDAPPVTRRLAEWVEALSYDRLGDEQVRLAKAQLKNILGVTFAGGTMPPGETFADSVTGFSRGEATVVGFDGTAAPHEAAMVNSHLSQVLEWEDFTSHAHSGAAVIPAALAAGEAAGATGEELVTAIVAGNEIIARISPVMTDLLNTGQALPMHQIQTPLVAGKLFGLDAEELQDAAGIAATQPQLTSIPAWTAEAKGMVTAEPVASGVRAAMLARDGLSGRRDLLENPLGYCYRVSDIRSPGDLWPAVSDLSTTGDPVENWGFRPDHYFNKRYPCDGFTTTAVQATLNVREKLLEAGVDPADPDAVESIRVHMNLPMASTATMFNEAEPDVLDRVLDADQPDWTYISLLFGGRYPLAAALLSGELTDEQFREDAIADPRIRELWPKFEEAPDLAVGVLGAQVSVTTAGGDPVTSAVGIDDTPLGDDATYDSFVSCIRRDVNGRGRDDVETYTADRKFHRTARRVPAGRRERIVERIDDIEGGPVDRLTALL